MLTSRFKLRSLLVLVALFALVMGLHRWLYSMMVVPWWWARHSPFGFMHNPGPAISDPHLWFGIIVGLSIVLLRENPPRIVVTWGIVAAIIALSSWITLRRWVVYPFPSIWPDGLWEILTDERLQWHRDLPLPTVFMIHRPHSVFELADLAFLGASLAILCCIRRQRVDYRIRLAVGLFGTGNSLLLWLVQMSTPVDVSAYETDRQFLCYLRHRGSWQHVAQGFMLLGLLSTLVVTWWVRWDRQQPIETNGSR